MHKLGKLPARHDRRTLLAENYLTPALPTGDTLLEAPSLPMFANDEVGDCGLVGQAHMIESWTWKDTGKEAPITTAQVLAAYRQVSGWNGIVNDPSDTGVNLLDALNHWRKVGIGGHKILGYVKVDIRNRPLARAASFLFGGLYMGFDLPEFVQGQPRWSMLDSNLGSAKPGSWGGHCVSKVRFTTRSGRVATWGSIIPVSVPFEKTYCDEAYGVLSQDWTGRDKVAPNGFNLNLLLKHIAAI